MMRSQPIIPIRAWGPTPATPSFPIVESKLTPAPTRPGLVSRDRLLDWLEAAAGTPVVAVCAPAGYGKTALAAEWAERDPRPFVWLSVDRHDNDPTVLLTYLAVGLDRVEPIDPVVFDTLASRGASISQMVLPRLGAALASKALPVVVVLDDMHLLQDQEGLEAVAMLVDHLPPGSQLALISRGEPPLPVARWRAEGRLAELGPGQAGDEPGGGRVAACSCWGRAAQCRRGRADPADRGLAGGPVPGRPRRSRPAARQGRRRGRVRATSGSWSTTCNLSCWRACPPPEVQFLTRTAVLERLSGPLCDAVLGTTGSAAVLASLERSNLLVIPLDRQRDWYRYHPLFRELLRGSWSAPSPSWPASSPAGGPMVPAPRAGRGHNRLCHGRR